MDIYALGTSARNTFQYKDEFQLTTLSRYASSMRFRERNACVKNISAKVKPVPRTTVSVNTANNHLRIKRLRRKLAVFGQVGRRKFVHVSSQFAL